MLFHELYRLSIAHFLASLLPRVLKTRISRLFYNYNSSFCKGIHLVVPYHPHGSEVTQKIFINTKEFIGWNIFFLGSYERDTNIILSQTVKAGFHVIEAGAHIGSETLLIANFVGGTGKVYAFEPNPMVKRDLNINIQLNNLEKVVEIPECALGENNADIDFFVNQASEPNQGMSSKYKFDSNLFTIKVKQETIDFWVASNSIPKIDYIKMDVQGAELDIISGAQNTIDKYRPIIFTEADESALSDGKNTLELLYDALSDLNYSVFLVCAKGERKHLNKQTLKAGNWIAFPN